MIRTAVIGSFVADLMAMAPRLPARGETVMGSLFRTGAGGKGFNQAVAAHLAGADIQFASRMGRDAYAGLAVEIMERIGLSTEHLVWSERDATGAALICVDSEAGGNQIVVVPGACGHFEEEDLPPLFGLAGSCGYLLMQLEIDQHLVERLAQSAAAQGVRVILNPAPAAPLSAKLCEALYLVTPNEVEAAQLTGVTCKSRTDCRRAARILLERGIKHIVITLGSQGVYCCDGTRDILFPNYDLPVVDTTGAGDAFNGGLLAGLSQGMDLFDAVAYGAVVSNLSVTKVGTAAAMPSLAEIRQFTQKHGMLKGGIQSLFP